MESYAYIAIDKAGKEKKGNVQSESEEKVVLSLKSEGLIPIEVKKQGALTKDLNIEIGGKPTARDYSVFCRQFVSMTKAGVTIIDALAMLTEQTENKRLQKAIRAVQTEVEKGESLTEAMKIQKIFPSLLVSMVEAGESSGSLDTAFDRMAIHFEKDAKTRAIVKKAMIYPIMVCIVAIGVVVVMLTTVIPSYAKMFEDMDMELPAITVMVMNMSNFMITRWYIVIAVVVALVAGIRFFAGTPTGKKFFGTLALKIPVFGDLTIKSSSARFARTTSTLLAAGISLVDAVENTAKTIDNVIIRQSLMDAREQIIQGVPLSKPLETSKMFPPMVFHMTRIGEEAGDIEGMLEKLADYYEEEVEMATQSLMAAMEPMIIIVLAAIVGFLIAAVMSPMLSMYKGLDNL